MSSMPLCSPAVVVLTMIILTPSNNISHHTIMNLSGTHFTLDLMGLKRSLTSVLETRTSTAFYTKRYPSKARLAYLFPTPFIPEWSISLEWGKSSPSEALKDPPSFAFFEKRESFITAIHLSAPSLTGTLVPSNICSKHKPSNPSAFPPLSLFIETQKPFFQNQPLFCCFLPSTERCTFPQQ